MCVHLPAFLYPVIVLFDKNMTESQVEFLFKAASSLQRAGDSKNLTFLRSYYLMRCRNITKGYGLPQKHFSPKVRCSKCCIEWNTGTETSVKAIKLSKKQRHRIRSQKASKNKELVEKRKLLLNSNEIIQVCSFCKKSTTTTAVKPEKVKEHKAVNKEAKSKNVQDNKSVVTSNKKKPEPVKSKKSADRNSKVNKVKEVNMYSLAKDIFLLNNQKNVLPSAKKEEQKVIQNNKKKKNKYAGLCEKAVLASAKMKEQKDKQNKLNLFLKPST